MATGSMSVATTDAAGRSERRTTAIAPLPVHRSTAIPSAGSSATARRARASVCGRGTNTPGSTRTRASQNLTHPVIHGSGSPSSRRATSRSIGPAPSFAASRSASASAPGSSEPPAASASRTFVRSSVMSSSIAELERWLSSQS